MEIYTYNLSSQSVKMDQIHASYNNPILQNVIPRPPTSLAPPCSLLPTSKNNDSFSATAPCPELYELDKVWRRLQLLSVGWMDFINDFKRGAHPHAQPRISVQRQQLENFWQGRTLTQMQDILTLSDPYILNFLVSELLQQALATRRLTNEAYIVTSPQPPFPTLLYIYDCHLFRGSHYTKEENEFLSSLQLVYRQSSPILQPVLQIIDADHLDTQKWLLVVKESWVLKVVGLILDTVGSGQHCEDKIILGEEHYYGFMQNWMKCYYGYGQELNVRAAFQAILILLENQILRSYLQSLPPERRHFLTYHQCLRQYDKPKFVEQFTLVEGQLGEIAWQSLKIPIFRLKYRVEEDDVRYRLFLPEEEEGETDGEMVSEEDRGIAAAFEKRRQAEADYGQPL